MMPHALGCQPLHRQFEHLEPQITTYDPSVYPEARESLLKKACPLANT